MNNNSALDDQFQTQILRKKWTMRFSLFSVVYVGDELKEIRRHLSTSYEL